MGKPPRYETSSETTPKQFPEVTPTSYAQAVGSTYLVESMMQMQQSLGELKANVDHLKTSSDRQTTKLDRISHIIFAAGVVLTLVLGVGGFFMNKIWDGVFVLMTNANQTVPKLQGQPLYQQPPKADQQPQKP